MNHYEELVMMMKGKIDTAKLVYNGTMLEDNQCNIGEIVLELNDYLVVEHLRTGYLIEIKNEIQKKAEPLKTGDKVLVLRLGEEYVILERLVQNVSV